MKNLVAKAGVAAVGSVLLMSTAGIKSASALFIEATETFSVSEDVFFNTNIGTGSVDRQFRSYDPNPNSVNGRFTSDDSIITSLEGDPNNAGGDVTDMAIVGSFTSEQIRGMVEFSLQPYKDAFDDLDAAADLIAEGDPNDDLTLEEAQKIKDKLVTSALLNFDVFQLGGIHPDNQHSLSKLDPSDPDNSLFGTVNLSFYGFDDVLQSGADGKESLLDYGDGKSKSTSSDIDGVDTVSPIAFFDTLGLTTGSKLSFNISTAVSHGLDNGWEYLGFRLSAVAPESRTNPLGACAFDSQNPNSGFPDCGAITFDNFTIGAVPTPAAILPTLFGMGMAAIRKRKNEEEDATEL